MSSLRPLLFLIFTNDLTSALKPPSSIFADDVKVIGSTGREGFRNAIGVVLDWAGQLNLHLNARKSHVISNN